MLKITKGQNEFKNINEKNEEKYRKRPEAFQAPATLLRTGQLQTIC